MVKMWKLMVITGLIFLVLGVIMLLMEKIKLFPLPGDIVIKKKGLVVVIPITSMIILSIIVTVVLNIIFRR
ncbi:MAG: DUF2905 domain-containing protein [Thermosipho sp. (in: Bacteria)]|nr:DUF2905 domain-containing protein [Thermosipho sp. (in: thermotogales)]